MLAKCISTKCDKYDNCLRAKSESTAEVLYGHLCSDGDDRWYEPIKVTDTDVGNMEGENNEGVQNTENT